MRSEPREEDVAPAPPWPVIRDDGRTLRAVDTIASVEAQRIRKKKQNEKNRCDSNGIGIIPRCPLKGTGLHKIGARRHMTLDRDSPTLFTIPNVLTLEDCKAIIIAAEIEEFYQQTQLCRVGSYGGARFFKNKSSEPIPPVFMPPWIPEVHFTRTKDFSKMADYLFDLKRFLWTPGLRAAFEGITLKGFKEARAVGITSAMIHRYVKGEMCELHESETLKLHNGYNSVIPMGYKVFLYLNGDQADDAVDSSGGSSIVAGGETVLYSQQYLIGNSTKKHIVKIAPKTGMAVCIAREQGGGPMHEIKDVAKGVMYMVEFFVQFGGFELPFKEVIVIPGMSQKSQKFQKLKWGNVWDKMKSKEDGDFIWSLWHEVVVINSWRVRFIAEIDDKCLMCALDIPETIAHRFWDCEIAKRAWDFAIGIINSMKAHPNKKGPWKALEWHHGIFGKKIPASFSKYSGIWLLLRGITLWTIWIERNDFTFKNTRWDASRVKQMIWHGLLDYARIAWRKALKDSRREAIFDALAKFHNTWGGNNLIYYMSNFEIMWNNKAPNVGLVIHA